MPKEYIVAHWSTKKHAMKEAIEAGEPELYKNYMKASYVQECEIQDGVAYWTLSGGDIKDAMRFKFKKLAKLIANEAECLEGTRKAKVLVVKNGKR